jgi:hypothetical protein
MYFQVAGGAESGSDSSDMELASGTGSDRGGRDRINKDGDDSSDMELGSGMSDMELAN